LEVKSTKEFGEIEGSRKRSRLSVIACSLVDGQCEGLLKKRVQS
jgi:hypothetical protein